MILQRLSGRGRGKLSSSHQSLSDGLWAEPIAGLTPTYGTPAVLEPAAVTVADVARQGAAIESAHAVLERPKGQVVRWVGRALRWQRLGVRAEGRAEVYETEAADADEAIETFHQGLDDAGEERVHRSPIARLRMPLLLIFGLADAAAIFFVAQKLLNLEDHGFHLFLNVGLSLLGFSLVVPAAMAAWACRRAFASISMPEVVGGGWRLFLAKTVLATTFVVLSLVTVGHLRWLGGESEELTELYMVLFTGLATFGAFTTEFLADNPARHALDRLELRRRSRTWMGRGCRVLAHLSFAKRDGKLGKARATMTRAAERVGLALAASGTDIAAARAGAPVIYGTAPIDVPDTPASSVLVDLHTFVEDTMLRMGLGDLVTSVPRGSSATTIDLRDHVLGSQGADAVEGDDAVLGFDGTTLELRAVEGGAPA